MTPAQARAAVQRAARDAQRDADRRRAALQRAAREAS